MFTEQVCTEHRHLHYSFVGASVARASQVHQGFCRNSRLGLRIVVARDVDLLEHQRNKLPVWLGGFLFLR